MGSLALRSHGTKVYRGNNGSLPFVEVPEVKDVTPPSHLRTIHNATAQGDSNPYKLTGMPDIGDFSFGLNFSPGATEHEAILDSRAASQIDVWKIEYSNAETWIFSGAVANFEPSAPVDDILTATVTIAVFGEVARS